MAEPKIKSPPPVLRKAVSSLHFSPTLKINEGVARLRAEGADVLHLGFGQSPFPVASSLQEALANATHYNSYAPVAGLPELRQAISESAAGELGIDPTAFDVLIGPGSKILLQALQQAISGDLLLPAPSWVSYAPQAHLLGDRVVTVPTHLEDGHFPTIDVVRSISSQARQQGMRPSKLLINTPNNPTGMQLTAGQSADLGKVCAEEGLVVFSDEIYGRLSFHRNHHSPAVDSPDRTIVFSGFSKYLSLGGWRLGYALIPRALKGVLEAACAIGSESWSSASAPIQWAVLRAFTEPGSLDDYVDRCRQVLRGVVTASWSMMESMKLNCGRPEGGFYLYPDFSKYSEGLARLGIRTSDQLAEHLLQQLSVATLPGSGFGDAPERLRLRLALCDFDGAAALSIDANSGEQYLLEAAPRVALALQRIGDFLTSLKA